MKGMKNVTTYEEAVNRIQYLATQLEVAGIDFKACAKTCYLTSPDDNPYERLGKVRVMAEEEAMKIRMKLAEIKGE